MQSRGGHRFHVDRVAFAPLLAPPNDPVGDARLILGPPEKDARHAPNRWQRTTSPASEIVECIAACPRAIDLHAATRSRPSDHGCEAHLNREGESHSRPCGGGDPTCDHDAPRATIHPTCRQPRRCLERRSNGPLRRAAWMKTSIRPKLAASSRPGFVSCRSPPPRANSHIIQRLDAAAQNAAGGCCITPRENDPRARRSAPRASDAEFPSLFHPWMEGAANPMARRRDPGGTVECGPHATPQLRSSPLRVTPGETNAARGSISPAIH
jgi:hypothetical protein